MKKNLLPIAERFHSVQGEGTWAGKPMYFLRLAGCSVGVSVGGGRFICEQYDGLSFPCDTDYRYREALPVDEALADVREDHICLTGGEPLNHSQEVLDEIWRWCYAYDKRLHIESSGTVLRELMPSVWLTVSPKHNWLTPMVRRADEIKLLVDQQFEVSALPPEFVAHKNIFLSPINNVGNPLHWQNRSNLEKALEVLQTHPEWRLSVQLHKYLGLQ